MLKGEKVVQRNRKTVPLPIYISYRVRMAPPRNTVVRPLRAGVSAAFVIIIMTVAVNLAKPSDEHSQAFPVRRLVVLWAKLLKNAVPIAKLLLSVSHRQVGCSGACATENCNTIGIRYGKYCGVGWTGCRGEKPCDDLDGCCQIHDLCVELNGLTNIKCHEECKMCIENVKKSGKLGFSNNCTYDKALPTLTECMDLSILVSQFHYSKQ